MNNNPKIFITIMLISSLVILFIVFNQYTYHILTGLIFISFFYVAFRRLKENNFFTKRKVTCYNCGTNNKRDVDECVTCNAPLRTKTCSFCHHDNYFDQSFCEVCNKKLTKKENKI